MYVDHFTENVNAGTVLKLDFIPRQKQKCASSLQMHNCSGELVEE